MRPAFVAALVVPPRRLLAGAFAAMLLVAGPGLPGIGTRLALARPAPASFADLSARLLPTVVNIATEQTLKGSAVGDTNLPDLPPGSPLEKLFKNFLGRNRAVPRHVTSLGSGFIIDPSGLIVTNNHVIEGADSITVTLNDGTSLPARLIGRDIKTDLALLQVTTRHPLPFVKFGDSDHARIGDWVIAIGNPFGLGSTVTAGIVSARNRDINAGPYDDFIQTDAPINRGNSGGPLVDMNGNVIGVNSAIYSPSGGSVGIGFAIPSNMVKLVVAQLRRFGAVRRGYIGVRIQAITPDLAAGFGLKSTEGALVAEVTPGGPAARAGIHKGDLIIGYDGKPVPDSRTLPRIVAETAIGRSVPVEIIRNGRHLTLPVASVLLKDKSVRKLPVQRRSPAEARHSRLGLSLARIDPATRSRFHLAWNVHGVVVTHVDPDSEAGQKDFRPGDVIVEVQNEPVSSPKEFAQRIDREKGAGKKVVVMLVNRAGNLTFVGVRLGG